MKFSVFQLAGLLSRSNRCFSSEFRRNLMNFAVRSSRSRISDSTEQVFRWKTWDFHFRQKFRKKFCDTCTRFLINSGKSMISWRSCDFLDRSKSRQIKGRNWRKSSTRSDFRKTLDVLMWFHRPLHSQGKTGAKWTSRNDKKRHSFSGGFLDFRGIWWKNGHLSGRLKALRHFRWILMEFMNLRVSLLRECVSQAN